MATKKIIGYILSLVGLAGLLLSFESVAKAINITLPTFLSNNNLLIVSLAFLAVGIFFLYNKGSSKIPKELPIYEGSGKNRQIVGYQRHSEK